MAKFHAFEIIRRRFGLYWIFSGLYPVTLGIMYAETPKAEIVKPLGRLPFCDGVVGVTR